MKARALLRGRTRIVLLGLGLAVAAGQWAALGGWWSWG